MNRLLVVGDPHFKVSNSLETQQFCDQLLETVRGRKNFDAVVILGDTLDTHEKIHLQPFYRVTKLLESLTSIIKVFLLIGNHDRMNNNVFLTDEHPFLPMKWMKNLVIIDDITSENGILFIPYIPTGRLTEGLEKRKIDPKKYRCVFSHQEYKGCQMGGKISQIGDIWREDWPINFSGHIHQFQQVQENLYYLGTPFQHSYSDKEDKGVWSIELEKNSFEMEKISLQIIKKKSFQVDVNDLNTLQIPDNSLVRINITGSQEMIRKMMSSREMKKKLSGCDINFRFLEEKKPRVKGNFNFINLLKERLSRDEELEKQFYEIFTNI